MLLMTCRKLWVYRSDSGSICPVRDLLFLLLPLSDLPTLRITNVTLLIAIGFLVGGFAAINRFGMPSPFLVYPVSELRCSLLPSPGANASRRAHHYAKTPLHRAIHNRNSPPVVVLAHRDRLLDRRGLLRPHFWPRIPDRARHRERIRYRPRRGLE